MFNYKSLNLVLFLDVFCNHPQKHLGSLGSDEILIRHNKTLACLALESAGCELFVITLENVLEERFCVFTSCYNFSWINKTSSE